MDQVKSGHIDPCRQGTRTLASLVEVVLVLVLLAMAATLWGCDGRSAGSSSNNQSELDATILDAMGVDVAPSEDGAVLECVDDRHLRLNLVPLAGLERWNDYPVSRGQSFRLKAQVGVRSCERLADVYVEMDHQTNTLLLAAFVWEEAGIGVACSDATVIEEELMAFPNFQVGAYWFVDIFDAPAAAWTVTVAPCADGDDCLCNEIWPYQGDMGTPCRFSCECGPGLYCYAYEGAAAGEGECGMACSRDESCMRGEVCRFELGGNYGVCRPDGAHHCPAGGCPPGFECLQNANGSSECWADFEIEPGMYYQECACDAQCPETMRCMASGSSPPTFCVAPCRGERDCPEGLYCGFNDWDCEALCEAGFME